VNKEPIGEPRIAPGKPGMGPPDNPYNIDHAGEQRAMRWLIGLMIGGFALSLVLLAVAYFFDAFVPMGQEPPPPKILQQLQQRPAPAPKEAL
jgi:hypothetical protein